MISLNCCCRSGVTSELKIEGDIGADPVWCSICGCNLNIEDVPISKKLANELSSWVITFGKWIDRDKGTLLSNGIELEEEFNRLGIALTKKVKQELVDQYIIHYSPSTKVKFSTQNSIYEKGGKVAPSMNKKPKIKRKDLLKPEEIWNAVISALTDYTFPSENKVANEVFTVFQYYSEMESGGHESLFTWVSNCIEEVGITRYLENLIGILEKINAHEYAKIEKKYGQEMWRLYVALENDVIVEREFYNVIEKANNEYINLNNQLGKLVDTYFASIYTNLIEVVGD